MSHDNPVTIIAGPCSVDDTNIDEIRSLASFEIKNRDGIPQRAIAGTRIVGLKSRTDHDPTGAGMGMDYAAYMKNMQILMEGGSTKDMVRIPSAHIAREIHEETGMIIATEVMNPVVQLPSFEGILGAGAFIPWNPAVNQLGWQIAHMASFAKRNGWHIGLKNGKWIGDHLHAADHPSYNGKTTMEKTWIGLANYAAGIDGDVILIHRGVDVPGKGDFRSAVVHHIAARVKSETGAKLFFDPSHSYGPKLRSHIVGAVVEASRLRCADGSFLYDGFLIEAGTSSTDTDQHITLKELQELVAGIASIREILPPPLLKKNEEPSRPKAKTNSSTRI